MTDGARETRIWRLGFTSGVFAFASVIGAIAYLVSVWVAYNMAGVESPRMLGAPLRTPDGVFMLTAQYETRVAGGGSRWQTFRGFEKVMHLDLWRLDAISVRPIWRNRIKSERGGTILNVGLLGADDGRLWLFMREPIVVSSENGEVLARTKAIEARNPPLEGVVPRAMSQYRFFEGYGLVLTTAADARAWLLDVQTLAAVPWRGPGPIARETAIGPQHFLRDGRWNLPLRLPAPDGALVVDRDRTGKDGRLQVARIAGADGRILWNAELPLSILQSVMPGEKALVLFGRGSPRDWPAAGDSHRTAHEWLVSLDTKDGVMKTFDLTAAH